MYLLLNLRSALHSKLGRIVMPGQVRNDVFSRTSFTCTIVRKETLHASSITYHPLRVRHLGHHAPYNFRREKTNSSDAMPRGSSKDYLLSQSLDLMSPLRYFPTNIHSKHGLSVLIWILVPLYFHRIDDTPPQGLSKANHRYRDPTSLPWRHVRCSYV